MDGEGGFDSFLLAGAVLGACSDTTDAGQLVPFPSESL